MWKLKLHAVHAQSSGQKNSGVRQAWQQTRVFLSKRKQTLAQKSILFYCGTLLNDACCWNIIL
jgi:hypothetical protein